MPSPAPHLRVRDVVISFRTDAGSFRAVDGVSFDVPRGEVVGLVGESGSGKSVTSLSILRLLPSPEASLESGEILFEGEDLVKLPERAMRAVRGRRISMIFQEPMTSLNPVYTVGRQIGEVVRLHERVGRAEARSRAIEMLRQVGIAAPETRVDAFAHELSGGMRQRVMIAMALACKPTLLIADEPTTALDVTVQAQILDLLRSLGHERKMSILFITHDLGVVAEFAQQIVVLYAGQVVETGPVASVFARPRHPYTEGLLKSIPPLVAWPSSKQVTDPPRAKGAAALRHPPRLAAIPGSPPDPRRPPPGCRFADRCGYAREACRASVPPLTSLEAGRTSRCLFSHEVGDAAASRSA